MTPLATKILTIIEQMISADELVLPTMPEIALKIREVVDDPDASMQALGTIIEQDAALTARLLRVSNSPAYRGANEIQDLNRALMRLGMKTTSSLAIGLAMEQMFQATNELVDKRLRSTWKRSSEIAGVANMLCKHTTNLQPDLAFLAGITHQIGMLPVLSFVEENPTVIRDGMTLDEVLESIHPRIGSLILKEWDFPNELINIPSEHLLYERDIAEPDYADIITVSSLQYDAAIGRVNEDVDLNTVKAFARLGIDPLIEDTEAEDVSEEMLAAMKILAG